MKLCRFKKGSEAPKVGCIIAEEIASLSDAGLASLTDLLEEQEPVARVESLLSEAPRLALNDARLCSPLEAQEVWAAGVTYLRSKTARMEESDFSASAYDRVYAAERPEIFFKAMPEKVVGPGEPVGIRFDARWSVPEPELALILNSRGKVAGFTIGNDMSSRDIEGENLLYLPQAKIYERSCALGPCLRIGASESEARSWIIEISIMRGGIEVFSGKTSVGQIKRSFEELARYLFRSQRFPQGAVLLTGTGVVPPDHFTLEEGDAVRIQVGGIGVLENSVVRV